MSVWKEPRIPTRKFMHSERSGRGFGTSCTSFFPRARLQRDSTAKHGEIETKFVKQKGGFRSIFSLKKRSLRTSEGSLTKQSSKQRITIFLYLPLSSRAVLISKHKGQLVPRSAVFEHLLSSSFRAIGSYLLSDIRTQMAVSLTDILSRFGIRTPTHYVQAGGNVSTIRNGQ